MSTIADVQYLAKQIYGKYRDKELYFGNPLMDFAKKTYDFNGIDKEIPADISLGGGIASEAVDASTQHSGGKGVKFKVPQATLHGLVKMEAKVLRNAKAAGDNAKFVDYAKKQHLDGTQMLMQELEFLGHQDGTGARATVLTATGSTITVAPYQAHFIPVGKKIRGSATAGAALASGTPVGSDPAGSATVTAVNTTTGTITVNGTITTQITGIVAGWSLYLHGIASNNGTGSPVFLGLDGWNPATVTSTLYCNVDRTQQPNQLGGARFAGGGSRQTLLVRARAQAMTDLPNQWKDGGIFLCHPLQFAEFEGLLEGAKEVYDAKAYEMGVRKITYRGNTIVESRNAPLLTGFVCGPEAVELSTNGKYPQIGESFEAPDGNYVLTKLTVDGNWIMVPSRLQRIPLPTP